MHAMSHALGAGLVLGVLTLTSEANAIEWKIKWDNGAPGCQSQEYLDKLTRYAGDNDAEAVRKAFAAGVMTGECTLLKSGESVFIVDTAIFSRVTKVRRKGETVEYWTKTDAVEAVK